MHSFVKRFFQDMPTIFSLKLVYIWQTHNKYIFTFFRDMVYLLLKLCNMFVVAVLLYTGAETAGSAAGAMLGFSSVISTFRLIMHDFRILCTFIIARRNAIAVINEYFYLFSSIETILLGYRNSVCRLSAMTKRKNLCRYSKKNEEHSAIHNASSFLKPK